ncbi:MAG: adenylate/guanylate cyclase domain-containing protein [Treponemataceae bacterium]|nr:adenylate/guanylate cyclase domain-containing protein [Treponemataceae bacterium]
MKKRAKLLQTKYFGLIIGLLVTGFLLFLDGSTPIFKDLNTKATDFQFYLKGMVTPKTIQEGVVATEENPRISRDIIIVGIDNRSLATFGKWPFPRSYHANLIDNFSRIIDKREREAALFLDIFFIENDARPAEDGRLLQSIERSGRVFLETLLDVAISDYDSHERMLRRQKELARYHSSLVKVQGKWKEMVDFKSVQAPLIPFGRASAGYGHANYIQDSDEVYRRQPLVAKLTEELEQIPLSRLTAGYTVDETNYERLIWIDRDNRSHTISTPLTAEGITQLQKDMERYAPPVIEDVNEDGNPEAQYYIVRKVKDYFIPAITLSLACSYFGINLSDVEVVIGKHIRLPNPTVYDPVSDTRIPYSIPIGKAVFDREGNIVKPAPRKVLEEIIIPINDQGQMLINYMGYRSSPALDGYRTFPVRSYASYAERVTGPDPETWPRSRAMANKIVMVGPFADGIAEDEKPTPYGLMYGVEIHANALNTILMNNFLYPVPRWLDVLLLVLLIGAISFLVSRYSTLWGLVTLLGVLLFYFLGISIAFETYNMVFDFPKPAIGMIFSFVSIVSYRAMTEEKEKKIIRTTFGKYVSPKVVDQILENPPELGGVDKELTVLFSDIRGFTTLSENMTPQELVNHLNVYLTAMTDIILEYEGTLDKYVGDEIMCFWGAPIAQEDHAIRACKCALRQMEKLKELNDSWPENKRIDIGIGINSGIMTVGNMGSPGRMNYTLMGDNVNLGARLEGTNKQYGTHIIISEFTYGLVKDHFIVRELDTIRVKGKNKPVVIYELVDSLDPL